AVEIPTLADRYDLPEFSTAHHIANGVLVRATQPLRAHLNHLLAGHNSIPREFGVLDRIGHRLLTVAVLARPNHFRQNSGMLVVAGTDHDGVEFGVGQHLLGVLVH